MEERTYPAIERALGVLRARLDIDPSRQPQASQSEAGADFHPLGCDAMNDSRSGCGGGSGSDRSCSAPIDEEHASCASSSCSFPVWKRAIAVAARLDRKQTVLRHLKLASPMHGADEEHRRHRGREEPSMVHKCFQALKRAVRLKFVLREEITQRMGNLRSMEQFSTKFPPLVRQGCVRRFGKDRLAVLYRKWSLKRRMLVQWMRYTAQLQWQQR